MSTPQGMLEDQSVTWPPYFKGQHNSRWKNQIENYIQEELIKKRWPCSPGSLRRPKRTSKRWIPTSPETVIKNSPPGVSSVNRRQNHPRNRAENKLGTVLVDCFLPCFWNWSCSYSHLKHSENCSWSLFLGLLEFLFLEFSLAFWQTSWTSGWTWLSLLYQLECSFPCDFSTNYSVDHWSMVVELWIDLQACLVVYSSSRISQGASL